MAAWIENEANKARNWTEKIFKQLMKDLLNQLGESRIRQDDIEEKRMHSAN